MMVLEGKFGQQQKGISGRQRSRDNNDQSQQTPDNTKQTSGRRETQPPEHEIREPGHHYDSRRSEQAKNENIPAIENSEKARSSKFSDEFSKTVRSKRASIKMRQNNPDIADLSDTNRPTRIAERFSELYDNEWTEAFEELSRRSRSEKETIEYLLSIVQEAYKFCANEAERQIKDITKVFDRILEFGSNDYNNKELISQSNVRSEEGHRLIVQYRKEMAGLAVERFKQVFMESKKHKWNRNIRLPAHLGALDLYGKKAVELTWWMSVQDPPVYLCPASESETDGFDKSLYRAYTKSGTEVDFFVWPALKLYKEGGVLMKGVVQFK
ncbi:uncharacterized protein LOC123545820 [Mercenaria mercenaria]|uniref:uncharacterized protein LOC123545820 n=1 Tax=Mercenaria mercenaria TaxID=6596 RepID=UPI00234E9CA6|nr:uncharacterized protein LOC123545820 [Mercenaria mercenaria]